MAEALLQRGLKGVEAGRPPVLVRCGDVEELRIWTKKLAARDGRLRELTCGDLLVKRIRNKRVERRAERKG